MVKIPNTGNWGREAAKERYDLKQSKLPDDKNASDVEAPQFPEDQRGPGYSNRASGFVRGAPDGQQPNMKNGTAENYPTGFDKASKTGKL